MPEHPEPQIESTRRALALIKANRCYDREGFAALLLEIAEGGSDRTTTTILGLASIFNDAITALLGDRADAWLDATILGTAIAEAHPSEGDG